MTKNESSICIPDEQMLNRLKIILNEFEQSTQSFNLLPTMTPCELQTIIDFQFYKTIPLFIRILLDGLILNQISEATNMKISLSNTTIHWDKIDQYINDIIQQLKQSYQLLIKSLESTSFQKHCQSINDDNMDFLNDFFGYNSPIEFYSIYTEFISYIYSFYLSIKSILASLLNKTSILIDSNDSTTNRLSNTKKSKKKVLVEQQLTSNENENETKFWNQLEKLEYLFNDQWMEIIENIRKYEIYLRLQGKLNDEECDRLEKELDGTNEQQSNR
jgi:hypothetical protein